MNFTRNKSSKMTKKTVETSTSTENLDVADTEENAMQKMIEGLRSANLQLVKDNKKKNILLGKMTKDNHNQLNMINRLTLEVHWWKCRSAESTNAVKALHAKYVMLSEDFVNIIIQNKTPADFGLNNYSPTETYVDKSVSFNTSNVQQTRAVKPMISGHTIQNPVINLPRVSPEQLERLSNQMRRSENGSQNISENEEVNAVSQPDENENIDEPQAEEEEEENEELGEVIDNNDNEEENENLGSDGDGDGDPNIDADQNEDVDEEMEEPDENNSPEAASESQQSARLLTIMEESDQSVSTTMANIDNLSASIQPTRYRRKNLVTSTPPIATPTLSSANSSNALSFEDSSLADISNTIIEGHVTMRRGRSRKRPNITALPDNVSQLSPPLETSEGNDALPESSMNVELSNTMFITGVGTSTSTPANDVSMAKRQRTRKSVERGVENQDGGDTPILSRKTRMKRCTVVLKRIAMTKRKSISPRKSPIKTPTTPTELPATNRTSISSTTTSTSSNLSVNTSVSPKARPSRRAKPTNLKESTLRGKMRRNT